MSYITLQSVTKTVKQQTILHDVSLSLERGELLAIIGPSGSGKSTLLHILGLLDRQTSGTYALNGTDVSTWGDDERAIARNEQIGFVFQQFNLLNELTALENVKLNLQFHNLYNKPKITKQEALERSKAALLAVGLGEHMTKRPHQLSGGQQQRVAIARAIVNNPDFIVADEPTGALDSGTTADIIALLKQLHATGKTIVIVTHNREVAEQCDRIVELRDGNIQQPK